MKIKVQVESADLRVGQANIRLVPVQDGENSDANAFFSAGSPIGNQAITMSLTNPDSFSEFMPGTQLILTFEKAVEAKKEVAAPQTDR